MTKQTFRPWDVSQSELFPPTYWVREHTVEPVLGQIKEARGFRQFLMRGLENVQAEWSLLCTAHNLLKLAGMTAAKPLPRAI